MQIMWGKITNYIFIFQKKNTCSSLRDVVVATPMTEPLVLCKKVVNEIIFLKELLKF
jgi:hypothetical protein